MVENEEAGRWKTIKYVLIIMGIAILLGNWTATQKTAADCKYNAVLGWGLPIGNGQRLYQPFAYQLWSRDKKLETVIPIILHQHAKWIYIIAGLGLLPSYIVIKKSQKLTSHGSARWANKQEIDAAGLGQYEYVDDPDPKARKGKQIKIVKKSGVVVGINPYTHRLMLHNGVEHILLLAPTRSGKGVNTIIPTGLIWRDSIFFFDIKGELWHFTSGYRQNVLKQKVLKFAPRCDDGSAARWNPLAEVNFQTFREISDVSTIVTMLVNPDGEKKNSDPFWDNSAASLLNGSILHLLYKNYQENRPIPSLSNVLSFISSPEMDTNHLWASVMMYPHISPADFLELEYTEEITSEQGEKVHIKKCKKNVLKEIYGEYIADLTPFIEALHLPDKEKSKIKTLEDLRQALIAEDKLHPLNWDRPDISQALDKDEIKAVIAGTRDPWYRLLVHPKIAEAASETFECAEQTRGSILKTMQTSLAIYRDPIVEKNTCVSDFYIQDLIDPQQKVSLYMVMQYEDMKTLRPLSRLFINTMLAKLIRDMKFGAKPNRLLLMLDEFPQLGKMDSIENALAVCAGYGIKMCIVAQDMNQLTKYYGKENSVCTNCHVQVFATPNLDNGGGQAQAISKSLDQMTIKTVNHSDGGGLMKGSNSVSETGRALMTAGEVAQMSSEKLIVFVAGKPPIFADKLRYYKQPWFTKKILPEAPVSDTCTIGDTYAQIFHVHAADAVDLEQRLALVTAARKKLEKTPLIEKSDTSEEKENITMEEEKEDSKNESNTEITTEKQPAGQTENAAEDVRKPAGEESAREESRRAAEGTRNEDAQQINAAESLQELDASIDAEYAASQDPEFMAWKQSLPHKEA